jgi:molybdopterin-guanine dinucleotide biosynthesis protein A
VSSVAPLQGLVLTGGQSRRMGEDKAGLSFSGNTLLDRAVALLASVVPVVRVSVAEKQLHEPGRSQYSVIKDEFHDMGPAAGILSAHLSAPTVAWLVIACDMPLLDKPLLEALIDGRDSQSAATAWLSEASEAPEPLCAIYEPATLAAFLREVQAGGNPSPRTWLQGANTRLLPLPRPGLLDGANTREEFKSLAARLKTQSDA